LYFRGFGAQKANSSYSFDRIVLIFDYIVNATILKFSRAIFLEISILIPNYDVISDVIMTDADCTPGREPGSVAASAVHNYQDTRQRVLIVGYPADDSVNVTAHRSQGQVFKDRNHIEADIIILHVSHCVPTTYPGSLTWNVNWPDSRSVDLFIGGVAHSPLCMVNIFVQGGPK